MENKLTIITPAELQNAGEIFAQNEGWLTKYRNSQEKLIAKAKKVGEKLTPELDAELTKWQVSAKACVKKMREDRMVFTSKFDEIKKEFTAIENELEKDLYSIVQAKRDASAAIYAKEDREAKAAADLALRKEQERIELIASAEAQVRQMYADLLADDKEDLFNAFNNCDAETIDGVEEMLAGIDTAFKIDRWHALVPAITSSIHTKEELDNIIVVAKIGKFDKVAPHYKAEIDGYAAHLLSLIPTRREEIAAGIASKAAEELKAKQDALEAANKQAAADKAAADLAEQQRQAQITADLAEAKRKSEMTAAPIESYSIEVTGKEGWQQIVAFYFQNADVELDKLGNVKLDSMKTFAERWAKSTGEMVVHDEVVYTEKYKAVARAKRATKRETVAV